MFASKIVKKPHVGNAVLGNLGLNDRDDRLKPTLVPLSSHIFPKSVVCGPNYSFIITVEGTVYGCGNNRLVTFAFVYGDCFKI